LCIAESVRAKRDIVCIREIQLTLNQSVKKLLELKIEEMGLSSRFRVLTSHIESDLGGRIIFQGMQNHNADSIKSLEGYDMAWVEEAQSLSQRSLDLLRPTIRKELSEIWFSWNPNLASDPVDVLLRGENPPPGSVVVKANYRDNPWFPEVLKAEADYDQRRDPEKFAHVWLGDYQQHSEARVFKNWVIEEFDRPKGTIYRLGADWGYSIDPSVLVRCSIDGNRLYVDYEAYRVGCEIVNLPELFMSVPEAEKWPSCADSARPETISHMQRNGFPKMTAAVKGAKSLDEGVAFLQSFDIVVHPRCQHVIDELTLYRYKQDPMTGKVIPILEDKNNHCIDALRYACEGARRARAPDKPLKYNTEWVV
jgi:phage terminase large subunit